MHKKDLFSMLTVGDMRVLVFDYAAGAQQDPAPKEEMNNRGVTLVELIIVIVVVGILASALGFSYIDWLGKYKVEKATKELYADLMNVRGMAMTSSRDHFVDFNFPAPPAGCGTYRIAEDTDEDNEGDEDADGVIDAGGHTFLPSFPKTVEYTITNNFENKIINFDKRGIVQPRGQAAGGTICLLTDNDPDYDCVVISQTRIIMGKLAKQKSNGGECKASNCVKK
jgi:prepilin-type N-terminal cleavage/methylation domain-containing protein